MSKIAIIYGSTTGNTETAAQIIKAVLKNNGLAPNLMDVINLPVYELQKDYDLILLGSSTWGEDEIELQEDFAEFYEHMDQVSLVDCKVAVFGCGDSRYTFFCGAVDVIEEKVADIGGVLIAESLKIDGTPEDAEEEIIQWAESIALEIGAQAALG